MNKLDNLLTEPAPFFNTEGDEDVAVPSLSPCFAGVQLESTNISLDPLRTRDHDGAPRAAGARRHLPFVALLDHSLLPKGKGPLAIPHHVLP